MKIAGLVYFSHNAYELGDYTAERVQGAVVTLFKWIPEGAWEQVGDAVPTDGDGYYHFDNVSGVGVAWFKIKVDATNKVPDNRFGWVQERVAAAVVRPDDIPDPGIIRVDVIYAGGYQLLVEEPEQPWYRGFEGHFVRFLTGGSNEMPNMGMAGCPAAHDGTCPVGDNGLHFKGCADGHWYSYVDEKPWLSWTAAGWAHFVFREPVAEPPGGYWGEGYIRWNPDRPRWAVHRGGLGDDTLWKVIIDFVDTALPE